jgi:hypothetical protein
MGSRNVTPILNLPAFLRHPGLDAPAKALSTRRSHVDRVAPRPTAERQHATCWVFQAVTHCRPMVDSDICRRLCLDPVLLSGDGVQSHTTE